MKTKRIISVFLAVVMCLGMVFAADAETQIPDGYTPVYTAEDLDNIRNNLSGKYILMNDIDLSVYENWEPIGKENDPFNGEIDGNGFLIKNLKISKTTSTGQNYIGLFGVASDSSFKNIIVENGSIILSEDESVDPSNVTITAGMIVAKTVGYDFTKVVRCSATGKIEVTGGSVVLVGGLVGVGVIDNCILSSSNYADININTKNYKQKIYIGGLIGGSSEKKESYSESYFRIEKSANFGDVFLNNHLSFEGTEVFAGGISGFQISGNELSECYNRGKISAFNSSGKLVVGGILGEAAWRLEKSYNAGNINITADENDLISAISSIKKPSLLLPIEPVSPKDFIVYNCYYLNSDIVPCIQNPDDVFTYHKNVVFLSESDFRNRESFSYFDFENVWKMEDGGYPVLKSQPIVTVKESIEIAVDEKYPIKEGKDYKIHSDSPLCIDYITKPENGEILALDEGRVKLTVTYDYGYMVEYDITITAPVCDDPIIPTPDPEPVNNVESAEIVYVPLKNRIVFSAGSPESPDGIVLKLTYKDGTEKTETIVKGEEKGEYYAGEERVYGSERATIEEYGLLTDTLYINDNTVSVKYDYFVPPTLSYIFMEIVNFVLRIVL